ncbi:MAG: heavy-metal-associated domain-containing protein, partial [Candidatus Hermodarchaeia archaeon]
MKETILEICNMKDPLCAGGVEKQIANLPGVHHVSSNPVNGTTNVHHDESVISIADLKSEVDRMGLYCHCESLPHHHGRMAIEETAQ